LRTAKIVDLARRDVGSDDLARPLSRRSDEAVELFQWAVRRFAASCPRDYNINSMTRRRTKAVPAAAPRNPRHTSQTPSASHSGACRVRFRYGMMFSSALEQMTRHGQPCTRDGSPYEGISELRDAKKSRPLGIGRVERLTGSMPCPRMKTLVRQSRPAPPCCVPGHAAAR
jgi:hypothetical protein